MRVKDIRRLFVNKKRNEEYAEDGNLEAMFCSFVADEPAIFGEPNQDYICHELHWYMKKSLNINDMPIDPPKIWKEVANDDGEINSNYGWCIFSVDNFKQFHSALDELKRNIYSRRAVLIYTRPSMHYEAVCDGKNDFMCTNTTQFLFRDGKLHMLVSMRSNDVVFGYRNDYAWQKLVHFMMCSKLGVQEGDMVWQAASLHVYPRHFKLVV